MILTLLRRRGFGPGSRCLDLGCGTGGNLQLFTPLQPALAVGLDLSPLALDYAQRQAPTSSFVRADVARGLPFQDDAFDVITMSNVLYHDWISSEVAVLSEVNRILRPNGIAVLIEPAFAALAWEMDDIGMARRRYRLVEFRGLCDTAGLDVELGNYFTSFGAVFLFARKFGLPWRARRPPQTTGNTPDIRPRLNELLYRVAMLEAKAVIGRFFVPIGTSLICLARKGTAQAASQR